MAGMQTRSDMHHPDMPDCACAGYCGVPYGNGGNSTLTNQNEDVIRAQMVEYVPVRRHDDGNYTVDDDFSMVSSMYREMPPL